jgi:hypothetical protein
MASIFEILDTTSLRYDTTLGFQTADSGSGPPSGDNGLLHAGWVRTGYISSPYSGPNSPQRFYSDPINGGTDNCEAWTNGGNRSSGTVAFLRVKTTSEETAGTSAHTNPNRLGPWLIKGGGQSYPQEGFSNVPVGGCNNRYKVWCVQD